MATLGTFVAGQILTAAELNAIGNYTSYTPAMTGVTIGNGTRAFEFTQINKLVHMQGRFTLGSTSAVTGTVTIPLPVAAIVNHPTSGNVTFQDTGTATFVGSCLIFGPDVLLFAVSAAGSYTSIAGITSTVPMTWVSGDFLEISIVYEAA